MHVMIERLDCRSYCVKLGCLCADLSFWLTEYNKMSLCAAAINAGQFCVYHIGFTSYLSLLFVFNCEPSYDLHSKQGPCRRGERLPSNAGAKTAPSGLQNAAEMLHVHSRLDLCSRGTQQRW